MAQAGPQVCRRHAGGNAMFSLLSVCTPLSVCTADAPPRNVWGHFRDDGPSHHEEPETIYNDNPRPPNLVNSYGKWEFGRIDHCQAGVTYELLWLLLGLE